MFSLQRHETKVPGFSAFERTDNEYLWEIVHEVTTVMNEAPRPTPSSMFSDATPLGAPITVYNNWQDRLCNASIFPWLLNADSGFSSFVKNWYQSACAIVYYPENGDLKIIGSGSLVANNYVASARHNFNSVPMDRLYIRFFNYTVTSSSRAGFYLIQERYLDIPVIRKYIAVGGVDAGCLEIPSLNDQNIFSRYAKVLPVNEGLFNGPLPEGYYAMFHFAGGKPQISVGQIERNYVSGYQLHDEIAIQAGPGASGATIIWKGFDGIFGGGISIYRKIKEEYVDRRIINFATFRYGLRYPDSVSAPYLYNFNFTVIPTNALTESGYEFLQWRDETYRGLRVDKPDLDDYQFNDCALMVVDSLPTTALFDAVPLDVDAIYIKFNHVFYYLHREHGFVTYHPTTDQWNKLNQKFNLSDFSSSNYRILMNDELVFIEDFMEYDLCLMSEMSITGLKSNKLYLALLENGTQTSITYRTALMMASAILTAMQFSEKQWQKLTEALSKKDISCITKDCKKSILKITSANNHTYLVNHVHKRIRSVHHIIPIADLLYLWDYFSTLDKASIAEIQDTVEVEVKRLRWEKKRELSQEIENYFGYRRVLMYPANREMPQNIDQREIILIKDNHQKLIAYWDENGVIRNKSFLLSKLDVADLLPAEGKISSDNVLINKILLICKNAQSCDYRTRRKEELKCIGIEEIEKAVQTYGRKRFENLQKDRLLKKYTPFYNLVTRLCAPSQSNRSLFAWPIWNLFKGWERDYRIDDPADSCTLDFSEKVPPKTFSDSLWKCLKDSNQGLYKRIQQLKVTDQLNSTNERTLYDCMHTLAQEWSERNKQSAGIHPYKPDEWEHMGKRNGHNVYRVKPS